LIDKKINIKKKEPRKKRKGRLVEWI